MRALRIAEENFLFRERNIFIRDLSRYISSLVSEKFCTNIDRNIVVIKIFMFTCSQFTSM